MCLLGMVRLGKFLQHVNGLIRKICSDHSYIQQVFGAFYVLGLIRIAKGQTSAPYLK